MGVNEVPSQLRRLRTQGGIGERMRGDGNRAVSRGVDNVRLLCLQDVRTLLSFMSTRCANAAFLHVYKVVRTLLSFMSTRTCERCFPSCLQGRANAAFLLYVYKDVRTLLSLFMSTRSCERCFPSLCLQGRANTALPLYVYKDM